MSGNVDQTQLVRKLIASCLIELFCQSTPGIGTKRTQRTHPGVAAWCGDHHGGEARGIRIGGRGATQVMGGTLPETLLHVTHEHVCFVVFNFVS
jgi:hypothetical protein